jgi:hypothetical protein
VSEPEITITPSRDQYAQLCRDLEILLSSGAESHTAAIIDAVHRAAHNANTMGETSMGRHRSHGPPPAPGGQS